MIKLVADKATDRLLGDQIIAPEGPDTIQMRAEGAALSNYRTSSVFDRSGTWRRSVAPNGLALAHATGHHPSHDGSKRLAAKQASQTRPNQNNGLDICERLDQASENFMPWRKAFIACVGPFRR